MYIGLGIGLMCVAIALGVGLKPYMGDAATLLNFGLSIMAGVLIAHQFTN